MFKWLKKKITLEQILKENIPFDDVLEMNLTDKEWDEYFRQKHLQKTIAELKAVKKLLDDWIEVQENYNTERRKDMKYVGNGMWINKKYKDLHECLVDVREMMNI
jgi:hypothetical protein